jgi:hypothetical protein
MNSWNLPVYEKKYLQGILITNKLVIEKSLKNQFSFPRYSILKYLGIIKYILSQAIILNKGYVLYKYLNAVKKICRYA